MGLEHNLFMHYLLDRSVHPAKAPEMSRKAKADLAALQERAFKVLAATPPRSRAAGFVETLKRILQRENNWTAWKKAKCPDFKRSDTSQKKAEGDDEDGVIQVPWPTCISALLSHCHLDELLLGFGWPPATFRCPQ